MILSSVDSTRKNLTLYSEAVRKIAQDYDAILVDHEKMWQAAEQSQMMAYWLSDAIHPNEYGHRAMAQMLFRELDLSDPESAVCRLFVP